MSFFIVNYMAHGRLTSSLNPAFDITKVVAIERASVLSQAEIYNKGHFVEYKCVYKDSCLDLVNLGVVDSLFHHIDDVVKVVNTPIPYPNSFFSKLIASPPCFVQNAPITPFYNVYSLPYCGLNNVRFYIRGKIKSKISESATTVKYKLSGNLIDIALNGNSQVELAYNLGVDSAMTNAELIFNLNHRNLYVVVLTKALDEKYLP